MAAVPYIEVAAPDAPPRRVDLVGEHVLVGSGGKSQVVVARPEFGREHLLCAPRAEGCYVAAARDAPTPVLHRGAPVERAMLPWGSELTIGPVRLVLHDGVTAPSPASTFEGAAAPRAASVPSPRAAPPDRPREGISPVVLLACAVCVPLAAWMFLSTPAVDVPRTSVAPPALFDASAPACPRADPEGARPAGDEAARAAQALAERMPFASQDGVQAVAQYNVAAACARLAGAHARAQSLADSARALAERLEGEYTNRRFRLARALEQDRVADALVEARMLQRLLAHRRGAYLEYLGSLERHLQLRAEEAAAAAAGGGR